MKMIHPVPLQLNKDLFLLYLLNRTVKNLGNMTKNFINVVMKLSVRYDKLDVIYFSVVSLAMILDAILCEHALTD